MAAAVDGTILDTGPSAREAAGRGARVVEVRGRVLPGLHDAHLHLGWLAQRKLGVDLEGGRSREEVLGRIRRFAERLPAGSWVQGRGWYNDAWSNPAFPNRWELDEATGGRPALMVRKDGHSAWASSAALAAAGIAYATPNPEGGIIDRDAAGEATGILREGAIEMVRRLIPEPTEAALDQGLLSALRDLAHLGLTTVQTMDRAPVFAALQRLHRDGRLPIRVIYNLPYSDLRHAERLGIRSGWGDGRLRIWGVKAFLDGSLGSRTAEMLDGSGVPTLEQKEAVELAGRCARAGLNVVWHAIGDKAVRRALDALEPLAGAHRLWRPRIEHAQCVHPSDMPRFKGAGAIASMQPIHAVSDRELADREWGVRTGYAYAWGALLRAGARLAFGSDAPVETADPLAGIEAASGWRRRAGWHPELAITPAAALRAYTQGAAYAAGIEDRTGRLRPGMWCDLTVVAGGQVNATIVAGEPVFLRRRLS